MKNKSKSRPKFDSSLNHARLEVAIDAARTALDNLERYDADFLKSFPDSFISESGPKSCLTECIEIVTHRLQTLDDLDVQTVTITLSNCDPDVHVIEVKRKEVID